MEWYDSLNPIDDLAGECITCGKSIDEDKDFCSRSCFEADND